MDDSVTPLASVTRLGALNMQVCVPVSWTDAEVKTFADRENPCGTANGWQIRTEPKWLAGCPVRNPCSAGNGMVHITLDA